MPPGVQTPLTQVPPPEMHNLPGSYINLCDMHIPGGIDAQ